MPDWKLKFWDRDTGPKTDFMCQSLQSCPVNAHNYNKIWALYHEGGYALDNDVEVINEFELTPGVVIGFQRDDTDEDCINNAVIGAEPGHPFIKAILDRMDQENPMSWPVRLGCSIYHDELKKMGLKGVNVEQMIGDIKVYDKEAFYPWRWDESPDLSRVTSKTFSIHWWEGSWLKT